MDSQEFHWKSNFLQVVHSQIKVNGLFLLPNRVFLNDRVDEKGIPSLEIWGHAVLSIILFCHVWRHSLEWHHRLLVYQASLLVENVSIFKTSSPSNNLAQEGASRAEADMLEGGLLGEFLIEKNFQGGFYWVSLKWGRHAACTPHCVSFSCPFSRENRASELIFSSYSDLAEWKWLFQVYPISFNAKWVYELESPQLFDK